MLLEDHTNDYFFMNEALVEAKKAYAKDEVPVGAVAVLNNTLIARAHNCMKMNRDPTAHAERLLLEQCRAYLNTPYLMDVVVYVTLEPCCLCTGAISLSRVGRLVFGASDEKRGLITTPHNFFHSPQCHWSPKTTHGIMAHECGQLLRDFFKQKRV
jgi:tRNA(adenine34) deaminase